MIGWRQTIPLAGRKSGPLCILALTVALAACAGPPATKEDRQKAADQVIPAAESARMARATLEGGDARGAIAFYEQALKAKPDDYASRLGLAEALWRAGETDSARLAYERAARIDPKAVEPILAQGRIAIAQRRLATAQTLFRQALALAGTADPRPLVGLGAALDLDGHPAEAQEAYRMALAIAPDDTAARNDLGLSLALSGHPRAGVDLLLDIVQSPSAPPQARHNLALAYGLMGNTAASESVLSADLDPGSVQNDLRYYAQLRQHLAEPPRPSAAPASPVARQPLADGAGAGKTGGAPASAP